MRVLFLFLWGIMASVATAQPPSYVRVSQQNSRYFETTDGRTYIPNGLNLCWPRFIADEAEGLAKMEVYFQRLQQNGGNYARIWLSAPFWEIETTQAGQYEKAKLARLDNLLTLAQRYGIRLKICLENFRQLTGYPPKFAGSVPFDRPIYAQANGGPLPDMDAYLRSDAGRQLFLNRAKALARRYGGHPAVFGWELWNEMDAVRGKGWESWTTAMLTELQTLFPNHLVMQSLGSYDTESKRAMYQRVTALPGNDVAQVHRYLDAGAKWSICQAPMDQLAGQAARDLLSFDVNKPVLVAEIGAVEANHAGPSNLYAKDTAGVMLHDLLFAPFFAGAAGPGHSWHWDSYVEKNALWRHFGRFAEAIRDFDPVREQAVPFTQPLPDSVTVYGLRGQTQTLLWIRDGATTWQTELAQGRPARTVTQRTVSLDDGAAKRVRFYDPWQNRWTEGNALGNTVRLPAFTRSVVVKLEPK